MQRAAPEALDLAGETAATRALYGLDEPATADFGRRCLLARRLLERGVRFVQVWSGAGGRRTTGTTTPTSPTSCPRSPASVDRPIAALLRDLKARGLLEDTLVVWTTEFGRHALHAGRGRPRPQRRHVRRLAGRRRRQGRRRPTARATTGPGRRPTDQTYCYDLHATILHLLGIDHERLTFRHNGIDRRLTDVHGQVIDRSWTASEPSTARADGTGPRVRGAACLDRRNSADLPGMLS